MAPGLAGFFVGMVLLVNTQLGQPEQPELRNPFPPNPESLQAGRLVYQQHCETCHGLAGRGDGPSAASLKPPAANLMVHVPLHADSDLFGFIHDGVEGTAMVPLGKALTDDEIWNVVNHIRTFEEYGAKNMGRGTALVFAPFRANSTTPPEARPAFTFP